MENLEVATLRVAIEAMTAAITAIRVVESCIDQGSGRKEAVLVNYCAKEVEDARSHLGMLEKEMRNRTHDLSQTRTEAIVESMRDKLEQKLKSLPLPEPVWKRPSVTDRIQELEAENSRLVAEQQRRRSIAIPDATGE